MVKPELRARIRIASGRASGASAEGASTSLVTACRGLPRSATTRSRSSISPSTGMPRIDCPRSASTAKNADRPDLFYRAAFHRAQQHLGIGGPAEHQARMQHLLFSRVAGSARSEGSVGDRRPPRKNICKNQYSKMVILPKKNVP